MSRETHAIIGIAIVAVIVLITVGSIAVLIDKRSDPCVVFVPTQQKLVVPTIETPQLVRENIRERYAE